MASVKVRIGPTDNGRRMSLADFIDAEEVAGYRYELARGVIEVVEVPNDPHAQIIDNLHQEFANFRQQNPCPILRVAHGSDVQLIIPEWESERHPDLAVIFRETEPNARDRRMPRLVVEVVSAGREARDRDYLTKSEEYFTFGIEEYWIVDPKLKQVSVLYREGELATWSEHVFAGDELIVSRILIGLAISVSSLWVDVDG